MTQDKETAVSKPPRQHFRRLSAAAPAHVKQVPTPVHGRARPGYGRRLHRQADGQGPALGDAAQWAGAEPLSAKIVAVRSCVPWRRNGLDMSWSRLMCCHEVDDKPAH